MPTGRLYRRGKKWYLDYHTGRRKLDGKYERVQRKSNGKTKAEAQAELDEALYKLRKQKADGILASNDYPIKQIAEDWIESLSLSINKPRVREEYARSINTIIKYLTDCGYEFISDLKIEFIEAFQRERLDEGRSHRTINLSLEKLNKAISWGIDRGLIASNPIEKAKLLPPKKSKFRRALTPEEAEALLENSSPAQHPIWFFLLSTGCRKDEALSLTWNNIDFKTKQIRIASDEEFQTKTEESNRVIPASPELFKMLTDMKEKAKGKYVFGRLKDGEKRTANQNNVFNLHMMRALRILRGVPTRRRLSEKEKKKYSNELKEIESELKKIDIHSLRYTFVTELIASGTDPKTVQRLAGHKSIKTTLNIYAQCRDSNAVAAINELPWKFSQKVS